MTDVSSIFLQMGQLASLLISLIFVYGITIPLQERLRPALRQSLMGVLFGGFAVLNMLMPIHFAPGVIVDTRGAIIGLAGAFGGFRAALITALIVIMYRLSLGGMGVYAAVGSAVTAALLGMWYYRRRYMRSNYFSGLFLLSIGIVISASLWISTIPNGVGLRLIQASLLPISVLYPLIIVIGGGLITMQTRSHAVQRALKESDARFRALYDETFQFIGILKPDGTLIEANKTALDFAGLALADVVGKPFWKIRWGKVSVEMMQRLEHAMEQAIRGQFVRYEVDIVTKNGQKVTVDFSIKPVKDEHGRVTLLITEGRDISYRHQLEQKQLELTVEHEKVLVLEQFIKETSHDLRTPLAILNTSVHLLDVMTADMRKHLAALQGEATRRGEGETIAALLKIDETAGKIQHRVPNLENNIERLQKIVLQLLDLTRFDNPVNYQFARHDLNTLVEESLNMYYPLASHKQISLQFTPSAEHLELDFDEPTFRRVVQNLVENAIQYTPNGGTVTVRTEERARETVISVADTGIGIPSEEVPHIFERFYRSEGARKVFNAGTGLGLAIVKQIVEAHRGRIQVETAPDKGTTFYVLLPAQ